MIFHTHTFSPIRTNPKWGTAANPLGGSNTNPTQKLNTNPQLNNFHSSGHEMSPKIYFTLQSGSPAFLKKLDVTKAFSRLGNIRFLRYNPGSNFGFVCFQSAGAFSRANNLLLPITTSQGKWELHTFQDFSMAESEEAFSHQILLESKNLPTSWEKAIIVKEFFKKFGEVTGLIHLGFKKSGSQRMVVSFKDSSVAQGLVDTDQMIIHGQGSTKVKAISAQHLNLKYLN